jgi:hypothetical protein
MLAAWAHNCNSANKSIASNGKPQWGFQDLKANMRTGPACTTRFDFDSQGLAVWGDAAMHSGGIHVGIVHVPPGCPKGIECRIEETQFHMGRNGGGIFFF